MYVLFHFASKVHSARIVRLVSYRLNQLNVWRLKSKKLIYFDLKTNLKIDVK